MTSAKLYGQQVIIYIPEDEDLIDDYEDSDSLNDGELMSELLATVRNVADTGEPAGWPSREILSGNNVTLIPTARSLSETNLWIVNRFLGMLKDGATPWDDRTGCGILVWAPPPATPKGLERVGTPVRACYWWKGMVVPHAREPLPNVPRWNRLIQDRLRDRP
ncbi:hypothetical protein CHU98_g7703 [Xylaria longipes]|nr:hypothetical protein CHU98_g7703 [Xylaria longipes]